MLRRFPTPETTQGEMTDERIAYILDHNRPEQLGMSYIEWLKRRAQSKELIRRLDDFWQSAYHADEAFCDIL